MRQKSILCSFIVITNLITPCWANHSTNRGNSWFSSNRSRVSNIGRWEFDIDNNELQSESNIHNCWRGDPREDDIMISSRSKDTQKDTTLKTKTDTKDQWVGGSGMEFNLFDARGGETSTAGQGSMGQGRSSNNPSSSETPETQYTVRRRKRPNSYGARYSSGVRSNNYSSMSSGTGSSGSGMSGEGRGIIESIQYWIGNANLPKIQCRVEPNTTLKVRKTFRPLKTIVRLGADFNTQQGVWQFKSSWEDSIIGGSLTLAGRELQFSKTWLLSVGAVEDLVTRLRLRAAVDLGTMKAYARLGFRSERLSPINVVEGFTLMKRLPLDGNKGHVKLEVKANFAFPEPEIEYSTENNRSFVGFGDIELNIDELNLLLDY